MLNDGNSKKMRTQKDTLRIKQNEFLMLKANGLQSLDHYEQSKRKTFLLHFKMLSPRFDCVELTTSQLYEYSYY